MRSNTGPPESLPHPRQVKPPNVWHNIAALSAVQAASYLLPLLTVPYVTRVLGTHGWGTVVFAQSILAYFIRVVDWGFSLGATRKVAACRDNVAQLSRVFFSTWMAQWLLAVGMSCIVVALALSVPFFRRDRDLYLAGVGVLVGTVLFPVWFLNGLERMKQAAGIQVAGRLVGVGLIFGLVRNTHDAALLMAAYAGTAVFCGILTVAWIARKAGLLWCRPTLSDAWVELRESTGLFLSIVSVSLYTTLIPTMLGILSGPVAVSHFALADRVRTAAAAVMQPVSQALFPRMSHLFGRDVNEARRLVRRSGTAIAAVSAVVSVVLWFAAEPIVLLLGGSSFIDAARVLQWLAPLPFIVGLSNILGMQILLPGGKKRAFNTILISAGTLSICMVVPLLLWKGAQGGAIDILIVECFVTSSMASYLFLRGFPARPDSSTKK